MKKISSVLFVLLLLGICYSQHIQVPVHFVNSPTTIELYNVRGQKVFSKEFSRYSDIPFSISNNLSNQVYILRVKNGAKEFTRKFTPNHKIQFTGSFNNIGTRRVRVENGTDNVINESQEENSNPAEKPKPKIDSVTNIIFINGVWNTREKAEYSYRRVKEAYEDMLSDPYFAYPGKYKFTLGYNKTHGGVEDIAETVFQILRNAGASDKFISENSQEWLPLIVDADSYVEALRLSDSLYVGGNLLEKLKAQVTQMTQTISYYLGTKVASIAEKIVPSATIVSDENETLDSLSRIIYESFENKERVIVIAHSQGNLYTNALIKDLSSEELLHTAVLNVAPPAARVSTRWHWTNSNDFVIIAARIFNPNILTGFDNYKYSDTVPSDSYNHLFWASYFHPDLKSRIMIDQEFQLQCRELPFWFVEEEKYHDSTKYIFMVSIRGGRDDITIEVLQNDGNYVLLSTLPRDLENKWIREDFILSNVAFENDYPVIRFTGTRLFSLEKNPYDKYMCFELETQIYDSYIGDDWLTGGYIDIHTIN